MNATAGDSVSILLVDDQPARLLSYGAILGSLRLDLVEARSGREALQRLMEREFAAILLDVNMPDMDGFEVAHRLRASNGAARPTILMLSSSDHSDDIRRCRELTLAAYVVKPVTQADLRAAIARAIGAPAEHVEPERPVARPQAPVAGGLRVLLVEDNAVNQRLAMRLVEDAGHQVTAVGDGIAAVEAFGREAFDLILMDLQMPEMGGIEATAAIRSIEAGRGDVRVPIIALTAHAMHGDRERCLEASMDGYVTKPIRRPELFAEISRLAPAPVETAA